jgi:hypothetical protein
MNRPVLVFISVAGLSLFGFANARSQDQSSQSDASTSQQAPGSNSVSQSDSPSPDKTAAEKVWTNEDLENLKDGPAISGGKIEGLRAPKAPTKSAPPKKADLKWYHDEIAKLQAQIPPLDQKIHDLQAALSGQQVNSTRTYGWLRPDDWHAQLDRLEKQKEIIENKMNDLEDEARHNGVPENTLPR